MKEKDFERFGITPGTEPFAIGGEKIIYEDPKNPDRILAIKFSPDTLSSPIKIRYYLTKIAHLLFPENIPDIHFYYSNPNIASRQKMKLGPDHETIRKIRLKWDDEQGLPWSELKPLNSAMDKISTNTAIQAFQNKLKEVGISFDPHPTNFDIDENNTPKYFDSIVVSRENMNKLESAIESRLQGTDLKRARIFLERLRLNSDLTKVD